MTSLRVFVDLTVQILNPSVGFPQLSVCLVVRVWYYSSVVAYGFI
jgi:hypothetical protein